MFNKLLMQVCGKRVGLHSCLNLFCSEGAASLSHIVNSLTIQFFSMAEHLQLTKAEGIDKLSAYFLTILKAGMAFKG